MADNKKVYQLTEEGKKDLELQLDYLKNTARKQNIIAIQDAMSQGDLSENADYSALQPKPLRKYAPARPLRDWHGNSPAYCSPRGA